MDAALRVARAECEHNERRITDTVPIQFLGLQIRTTGSGFIWLLAVLQTSHMRAAMRLGFG